MVPTPVDVPGDDFDQAGDVEATECTPYDVVDIGLVCLKDFSFNPLGEVDLLNPTAFDPCK